MFIDNRSKGRAINVLKESLASGDKLSILSGLFSIYAFNELKTELEKVESVRLILNGGPEASLKMNGDKFEAILRNNLDQASIARACAEWVRDKVEARGLNAPMDESWVHVGHSDEDLALRGAKFTAASLGMVPTESLAFITSHNNDDQSRQMLEQFNQLWSNQSLTSDLKARFLEKLDELAADNSPQSVYLVILFSLFRDFLEEADAERIIRQNTGFYDSAVWNKLYKFQRDGVLGAIEKLERHNGCIIADSVGLGKTFEALAVIKYYELRNDRVLVLVPKRLRENWTIYTQNDKRNSLIEDRLSFDVLNHTDLSRTGGTSGSINLDTVNWQNYDLVVIDESHNFRNNHAVKGRTTRYERLMKDVLQAGVKTRVLMLSATPVNTRMTDLKNQVLFATEGQDDALKDSGIKSIDGTLRKAQTRFNAWLKEPAASRTASDLIESLGMDYVRLLDLLTIARSRKHITKYYGLEEVGQFPTRLKPITLKPDIDSANDYPALKDVFTKLGHLKLAAYSPMSYVKPAKVARYEQLYDNRLAGGGKKVFRQVDREQSLVYLMRINMLKRMESSIHSFTKTVKAVEAQQSALLKRITEHSENTDEEISIDSFSEEQIAVLNFDDDLFADVAVGNKVKVLFGDMDLVKWRQALELDEKILRDLAAASELVDSDRDVKLAQLRKLIKEKSQGPYNEGNRKLLVFTAFSDTAEYLYKNLAEWANEELGLFSALITGSKIRTTHPHSRTDTNSILINFSPISKERSSTGDADHPEIDLIFATDTISEGQNLQDCDAVVNFDIHWNPVRIIQRFGRIDRLGSRNKAVQLINFMPNMELDEYIQLEAKVSGRMVLLDASATGDEDVLNVSPDEKMNDLEYRRKQLEQLQNAVVDLEDLSGGVSITDLTLSDFRMDITSRSVEIKSSLTRKPVGLMAVIHLEQSLLAEGVQPGAIFLMRSISGRVNVPDSYPLSPYFLVYVSDSGRVMSHPTEPKLALDVLRRHSVDLGQPDPHALSTLDKLTRSGTNMARYKDLLGVAILSIAGAEHETRAASVFSQGATKLSADAVDANDVDVVAWVAVLAPRSS